MPPIRQAGLASIPEITLDKTFGHHGKKTLKETQGNPP
jgi:hypothetical protein